MSAEVSPLLATFQKKYVEFAADLRETFPELSTDLDGALAVPEAERIGLYSKNVMSAHKSTVEKKQCPGAILPGVVITPALWETCGERTKKAIFDYISILDLCCLYEHGLGGDGAGAEFSKEWADNVMREWRTRLDKVDFDGLANKFMSFFGGGSGALPQLPEKFLKGKLAKLAEDMVREFKPEDFGLRPEDLAAVESDPTRAFEILMQASAANPNMLQRAMTRVAKKRQEKVMRGELRPQELVAEAEELIKEFQSHPAFVEMMESFRSAFSFEDPDLARAAGQDGSSRLAIARSRLRKKLEARKAGGGSGDKK